MLFPLHQETPRCRIFTELNAVLLYFLSTSVNAVEFGRELFSGGIGTACWNNVETREKFSDLWDEIARLTTVERHQLSNGIRNCQNIQRFFVEKTSEMPAISPENLKKTLSKLSTHFFERTKDLAGVREACNGETIQAHFEAFRTQNGAVCSVCGTELLAQRRADVSAENQWRGPYDHLLSKDKYPAFAIHPDNLVPICTTCNSKAKGAKELLVKKQKGHPETRRLCFYPYTECCQHLVHAKLLTKDAVLALTVSWDTPDLGIAEKMSAWDEVYQVKARVEEEQRDFVEWLDIDCRPRDLADFRDQIERRAREPIARYLRNECWFFWRYKIYAWLHQQGEELIAQVWAMMAQRRDDPYHAAEFGR